ncbi:MAG TPA: hypothetical protein VNU92_00960 [Edaphobacter sp.]|jgi:hypothetical protein|nr:hypothetical protein [Edaphobacter sp.]
MTTIRSTWTLSSPPPLTGLLPASDWSGAVQMAVPNGTLLAQNDATHLYVGLDITAETGVANTNDYFWFVVDINNNGVIDAYRDKLFSILPTNQNRLYMFYMLGPNTDTPVSPTQVIPSKLLSGFGPSMLSATNHRQWQLSFDLTDLGITIDPLSPAPVVNFGLRIGTLGGFVGETPPNPLGNFADLHSIVLSTMPAIVVPPGSLGPVIAAVGLIGTGDIAADGYCTITPPYYLNPTAAAFCGTLNLIGNVATLTSLWAAGARKYKVLHRYGATVAAANAATFSPILQAWANFEIVGTIDVWQSFGPDPSGFYTFVNPALPYTIQNLLFQWTTSAEPDGVHQFEINFFNAANVAMPVTVQVLTLKLDNQPPIVKLLNVLHAGTPVSPCAIVTLASITDGVQLQYEAYDSEGDLYSLALTTSYGAGVTSSIYSDSYPAHASPSHIWQGVTSDTRPVSPAVWVPPYTCAYLFEITAWTRTTNGYSYPVVYAQDFQTVTLIKPAIIFKPIPISGPSHLAAAGFEKLPETGDLANMKAKALPAK